MTKEKLESNTSSSTSKKATLALAYLKKNYFGSNSDQKLRFPTLTPQPWLKPKQLL